tara:strand:+ start:1187 stop:2143 length:957 start_codon:yes stop_codon:yes gene_type:complete
MSSELINFINHLLTFNNQKNLIDSQNKDMVNKSLRFNIDSNIIINLSNKCKSIFNTEPNLLRINTPIYIYGDIHGQYQDLIRFLKMTGLPPNSCILFMGDYVDRGPNSIEVIALLFAMKILYPNHVFLLRGNHECPDVNKNYGFYQECLERFKNEKIDNSDYVFNQINLTLCSIPLAALINNKVFCVHGGISPNLKNIYDLDKINRFSKIPDNGILCDILWSDPKSGLEDWEPSNRGTSYTYNENALDKFMNNNNLELVCRAHQMVNDGFKFFNNNKLVTIFSAPNYCGECGNDGAVMHINDKQECSFLIIKPINNVN